MVEGYNIAFKYHVPAHGMVPAADYTMAGRTQDDLTISAKIQERLTKDDAGVTNIVVVGHDVTFRASGLIIVGTDTTLMDRDAILAQMLGGSSFDFVYLAEDGGELSGKCVMTNYTESSNASDDATWTADFRTDGELDYVYPVDDGGEEPEEPVD